MILGIESTAHTLSFGLVEENGRAVPSVSNLFRPKEGGIHPREAADHHSSVAGNLLSQVMVDNSLSSSDITAIAFSQGPGLGPCLRVGASVARALSNSWRVPLIGVNHCVAHIEIGRNLTGCEDPVLLYVSGGNTQVIARRGNRYRVLGETLDIGIGNMLDKFARSQGFAFPGGPEIEKHAATWLAEQPDCSLDSIQLPYGVQGMDLAFSGILTAAIQKKSDGHALDEVCWSLQEHSFSTWEMATVMCQERGGISYSPDKPYCVDNGTMIAELGRRMLQSGVQTDLEDSAVSPGLRTDQTNVTWH